MFMGAYWAKGPGLGRLELWECFLYSQLTDLQLPSGSCQQSGMLCTFFILEHSRRVTNTRLRVGNTDPVARTNAPSQDFVEKES